MTRALVALALAYAGLQVATEWIPPYELLHDELYYWVGAKHPGDVIQAWRALPDGVRDREWRHFGIDLAPQLSTRADAPGD